MGRRQQDPPARERILSAARRLFAERGYQNTSMAAIARAAHISEAGLYEYFSGKEALLLTIPAEWAQQALVELDDQLFGIEGALPRLRKFLWWYLRYIERTELNARIVFLHLKTNRALSATDLYADVRRFYGRLVEIIEEGQRRGEVDPGLNPYVARSLILGAIEHSVIRWLLKDERYSLFDHAETLWTMLKRALTLSEEQDLAPEHSDAEEG